MTSRLTLGLLSDTHSWLDPQLLDLFKHCDAILHAGDIGDEAVLDALKAIAPLVVVRGNIDGGPLRFLPLTNTWQGNGRTVALLHIAGNPRRPHKDARRLIEDTHPDVLLVGHSHLFVVGRVGTTLWINPGAAGRHGFHDQRTAAFLHIDPDGTLHLERINLGPRAQLTRGPTQDEPCEL